MAGNRIKWSREYDTGFEYETVTKLGDYYGKIKHTCKHWRKRESVQMAIVKFDSNKGYSRVPFDELVFDP